MKLVYGITASTEIDELTLLVTTLRTHTDDEIVVLCDSLTVTEEVTKFLNDEKIPHYAKSLNNNFGEFKTALNVICKDLHGADYVFQLDADENINSFIIENIKPIVELNPDADVFFFPRMNFVYNITDKHLAEWGWNKHEKGYLNFPDYQGRVYKSHLKWVGKVHEKINCKTYVLLPEEEVYSLYHFKTIEKQEKQNNFYKTI